MLAVPIEGEERTKLEDARDFLRDLLSDGPIEASKVEKQARGAGIATATLRRAKTALGIKPWKSGFDGGWNWELPRRCSSTPEDVHSNRVSTLGQNEHLRESEGDWEEVKEAPG